MTRQLNSEEYQRAFSVSTDGLEARQQKALEHALEIRKFEIELYWKRATYFWTFIAAAFAAYGVIQASDDPVQKAYLSVLVGVLSFVFSYAWQAVNRGSKQWQENWENHVAQLEDKVIGPLYKTVIGRTPIKGFSARIEQCLTGPFDYSVSKINQIISLFVVAVWFLLICKALPPINRTPDPFLIIVIGLGVVAALAIRLYGRTNQKDHILVVKQRASEIMNEPSVKPNASEIQT
jgi:hypothetical protein